MGTPSRALVVCKVFFVRTEKFLEAVELWNRGDKTSSSNPKDAPTPGNGVVQQQQGITRVCSLDKQSSFPHTLVPRMIQSHKPPLHLGSVR